MTCTPLMLCDPFAFCSDVEKKRWISNTYAADIMRLLISKNTGAATLIVHALSISGHELLAKGFSVLLVRS